MFESEIFVWDKLVVVKDGVLDLSDIDITSYKKEIINVLKRYVNIKGLILRNICLTDKVLQEIVPYLFLYSNLSWLDLSYNFLVWNNKMFLSLSKYIAQSSTIKKLNLSYNLISNAWLIDLTSWFRENNSLISLDISNNYFNSFWMKEFLTSMVSKKNIKSLNISLFSLDIDILPYIDELLNSNQGLSINY